MTAKDFIDLLAEKELLAQRTLAKLRQQIQSAGKPVSARAVAKALVKSGQLTEDQARRLLQQLAQAAKKQGTKTPSAQAETETPPSAEAPSAKASQSRPVAEPEELGLLEDKPAAAPSAADRPIPPSRVEEELGLMPDEPEPEKASGGVEEIPIAEPVEASADEVDLLGETEEAVPMAEDLLDDTSLMDTPHAAPPLRRKGSLWQRLLPSRSAAGKQKVYIPNRWDSPLMLVGGGALILMIFLGLGLYFYLSRGTGDDAFNLAYEDYRQQAYGSSIDKFEQFINRFSDHPQVSLAKVRVGLAKIWLEVDAKNWERALEVAKAELPRMETEEAFPEARPELATLLPEIMEGFADAAIEAPGVEEKQRLLALANDAYELVQNTAYLPSSLRRDRQPKIDEVLAKLETVKRQIDEDRQLQETIVAMKEAAQAGEIAKAYELRRALLRKYSRLEVDQRLVAAVGQIAVQEQTRVAPLAERPQPVTTDVDSESDFFVALANRSGETAGALQGQVLCAKARGAAWGVQADTGKLLWRRFVGMTAVGFPISANGQPNGDPLLLDAHARSLVRLDGPTGTLRWRLPVDGQPTQPVLAAGKIYLAVGREQPAALLQINAESGEVESAIGLPVPVSTSPYVDAQTGEVLLVAAESSLYRLDLSTGACRSVVYLGHERNTVQVPPVQAAGLFIVAENPGRDFALLHVLGPDDEDPARLKQRGTPKRLQGRVATMMQVFGRRILVSTDRGHVYLLQIDPGNPLEPLQDAAMAVSTVPAGTVGYPLLDGGSLWLADNQLSRFEVQIARGQIIRKWVSLKGDFFMAPLERHGDFLIHLRQRRNRPGVALAASRIVPDAGEGDGEVVWETELATPPADSPLKGDDSRKLYSVSTSGALYELSKESFAAAAVTDATAVAVGLDKPLAAGLDVPQIGGRIHFTRPPGSQLLLVSPRAQFGPLQVVSLPGDDQREQCEGALFQQGLLLPVADGAIHLLDIQTGRPLAEPYRPPTSPGEEFRFLSPAPLPDGSAAMVYAAPGRVFRVALVNDPQPHLVSLKESTTDRQWRGRAVATGEVLYVPATAIGGDALLLLATSDLQPISEVPLAGRVLFGPHPFEEGVLVADEQKLLAVGKEGTRWQLDLNGYTPVGRPLLHENRIVLVTTAGRILLLDPSAGTVIRSFDLGEPLATGAVHFSQDRFVVQSADGTVHIVTLKAP